MPEVICECPCCNNLQIELTTREGDKYAWGCRGCGQIIENGKPFILDTVLDETHYRQSSYGATDIVYYHLRKRFVTDDWRRGFRRCD